MRARHLKPDRITAIFYDVEEDNFVFIRADGSEGREPHSEYLANLAGEYHAWFTAVNGYSGIYAATYSRAIDVFAGRA